MEPSNVHNETTLEEFRNDFDTTVDAMASDSSNENNETYHMHNNTVKKLLELRNQLDSLINEFNKTEVSKKSKTSKKSSRPEKVYQLSELYEDFVKKHQITEAITEKQLESYLQYYFDVKTNLMKSMKDNQLKTLNLPQVELQVIKEALKSGKTEVIPKKEDLKYFVNTLKNKESTLVYNGTQYKLNEPEKIMVSKDLCKEIVINDKIKPRTLYQFNDEFFKLLQKLDVVSESFDNTKNYSKDALNALFNKYNNNPFDLYQEVDKDKMPVLKLLNITDDVFVTCNDCVYIKPKTLKDHVLKCCDNTTLLPEYQELLKEHKLTNYNNLLIFLKSKTK